MGIALLQQQVGDSLTEAASCEMMKGMYPVAEVQIASSIPADASFWVPKPREIGDEGFGFFRDVWPITNALTAETKRLLEWERVAAAYAAEAAQDANEFEVLARRIEAFDPGDDSPPAEFPEVLTEDWFGLAGLELGVAGLTYALSNAGFFPAASCRSHAERSWSDSPVVLFAGDEVRVQLLQPLIEESGCGLRAEHGRGEPLLVTYARTIQEMMNLAEALFQQRVDFRKLPKTGRRQRVPAATPSKQLPLF